MGKEVKLMPGSPPPPRGRCCPLVMLVLGLLCIILAAVMYPALEHLQHTQITKKVALTNGSETYKMWQKPTLPIYMQFYVFDLINPVDVVNGGRPVVVEKGPYTYREHREKVNITFDHKNGTVTYRENKSYEFVKSLSAGDDTDNFTTVNLPVMTIVNSMRYWHPESPWMKKLAGLIVKADPFVTKTVNEMVFGYQDMLLTLGKAADPKLFYTDVVGIMAEKNNTDDGVFTIFTGEHGNVAQLGQIKEYNHSSTLPYWTSDACNMINGSDGSLFSPFVKKDEDIYMFSTDICRSIYATYNGSRKHQNGLDVWRFQANRDVIANSSENPQNAGFCTPAGQCMGSGVLNVTTCKQLDHFPVPMAMSFPHFYLADQKYRDAIGGMSPDASRHTTFLDIEPNTGIMLKIEKKLQVNVHIQNIANVSEKLQDMVYPIMWINESASLDKDNVNLLRKELADPVRITHIAQYVLFAVGSLLVLVGCVWILTAKRQKRNSLLYPINQSENIITDREALIT